MSGICMPIELHIEGVIADLEQALAGGQIISKSVAKVATTANGGFRVGTDTQLLVESFAGFATAAVFQDGDTVRLRSFARAAGALTVTDAFGTVTLDTTYSAGGYDAGTMTQRYTFTKTSGTNILANTGTLALDYGVSGNGYYEVTAVDGAWGAAAPVRPGRHLERHAVDARGADAPRQSVRRVRDGRRIRVVRGLTTRGSGICARVAGAWSSTGSTYCSGTGRSTRSR